MYTLFVILAVITAVLLAIVVLIQESKGGGLASNVSSANSVLGVRKTTDFVEKATWTLAALLVVFSVATSFIVHQNTDGVKIIVFFDTGCSDCQAFLLEYQAFVCPRNWGIHPCRFK